MGWAANCGNRVWQITESYPRNEKHLEGMDGQLRGIRTSVIFIYFIYKLPIVWNVQYTLSDFAGDTKFCWILNWQTDGNKP